jgi:hypothetical protein
VIAHALLPRDDDVTVKAAARGAGLTLSVAVLEAPPKVAVIVTDVLAVTDDVETVKLTLVAPAATVTVAGTVALEPLLESDTTEPPVGAAADKVTVP